MITDAIGIVDVFFGTNIPLRQGRSGSDFFSVLLAQRPKMLKGEEKGEHLRTEGNHGEGAEDEDSDEEEAKDPTEEA